MKVLAAEFKEIPDTLKGGGESIIKLIKYVGNWLFTIFMVLAIIFLILAAYKYLFSGGSLAKKDSPAEVQKAHKMLIYAVIAVAVAVLAPAIINVIAYVIETGAR
jgi:hypothetical protein